MDRMPGACLCGACTLSAVPEQMASGACHCSMCRKWSGGMLMTVGCGDSVEFSDGAPLGVYAASPWGERVFCKNCGSSLAWRTKDGAHHHVSVHVFEDCEQFPLGMQVFIDDKPGTYALAQDTRTMTGAEVFALFAPKPEGAA